MRLYMTISDAAAVGGMRKRIVVCPEDMPLTIQRKQADWDCELL